VTPRRWARLPTLLALGALILDAAATVGLGNPGGPATLTSEEAAGRFRSVEARARALTSELSASAESVAALPEARRALAGDRASLASLFLALDALRATRADAPSLAVRSIPLNAVAWTGRIGEIGPLQALLRERMGVFVLEGTLSTTLVAVARVRDARGGDLGLATAELAVSVRRNVQNEFLRDFDLLAAGDPAVTMRYVDSREETDASDGHGDRLVRDAGGHVLAVATFAPRVEQRTRLWVARYRAVAATLGGLFVLSLAPALVLRGSRLGLALASSALRLVLLLISADPDGHTPLLSPDIYASATLGPLLHTPLDLFLTALWVFSLAAILLWHFLALPPPRPSRWRSLAADSLALPVLAAVFAAFADVTANCTLDLGTISPVPRTPHLLIQWSLLLLLAAGAALMIALFSRGSPLGSHWRQRLLRIASWAVVGTGAYALWPRDILGIPLVPAIAFYLLAALLGASRESWLPRLPASSPAERAGMALAVIGVLTLLLHPTMVHYAGKSTRREIEREDAPSVLRQPEWRAYVLGESRKRVDALSLLEDAGAGPPPLVDELAFAVWTSTDLAAFGFSSAVEIQDPTGLVISRFALNLPSVAGPATPMPGSDDWVVSSEPLPIADADRRVLHARRRLSYHGQLHGAVHLYVGDDFWNLPFVTARDPYSVLYRTAARAPGRERAVELFAFGWNRDLLFSSAERPPVLTAALLERVRGGPFWTTLPLEDGARYTYLFSDSHGVYGLGYPRIGPRRFAAELVEAVTGMVLSAAMTLLAVVLFRTLLRRSTLSLSAATLAVRQRFSLRLFLTFIAVAALPVIVLEVVVRGFVTDRLHRESENQALERAAVARKAVEDFAKLQRVDAPGRQPVTDAALVWVASLIRSDLDVFEHGRVLASSKRELYASSLLSPRVSGTVFRALALEARPAVLDTERIGGFSYMVVAVPVRLDRDEPGILSIPLALRQREVEAVLSDLDRSIRLASILFLAAAAGLAHSMARRISGPVLDLTHAAQRIARGDLAARVATASRDEFLGLVESFNQMAGDLDRQRQDLERSNRLAAWAEMARQVAHEVKNPLTPIQLSAEHLRRVYGDPGVDFRATLETCTESILQQVEKLREMVTEFSAFARPPVSAPEALDLVALVEGVVRPYARVAPPGVTLVVEGRHGQVPPVRAERRLVERAVVNLLENALQAVGDRGRITLNVGVSPDGRNVEVDVQDSGPGLDAEARARAFEPFFSTKTGGSGLGLALVRKIAEDHGGGASIDAEPGRTRARMWLPADLSAGKA